MSDAASHATLIARYIAPSETKIWSLSVPERLRRVLARSGIRDVAPWGGTVPRKDHLILRADYEYAPVLLRDLAQMPGAVLVDEGRPIAIHVDAARAAPAAAAIETADRMSLMDLEMYEPYELSSSHDKALRKRDVPYALPVTKESRRAIERRTFEGSYKGVTDFVTRHIWPVPARMVTRFCAWAGITPNMVTTLSLVFVLLAMWLFWTGQFGPGLICAWLMTFLDTVDGKLARTTLNSSKWGNVYDHGIDLIHPPFWYWAWFVGLAVSTPVMTWALWVIIAGYVAQRVQEGIFIAGFGLEMHVWRKFDSRFRLFVARRNPNLVLLTGFFLLDMPAAGFLAVAIWTGIGFVVHCVQILQALFAPRPIQSWLDD